MKKYPIRYLPSAERDLVDIFDYIRRDSPSGAAQWLQNIDHRLGRLSSFPRSGASPKDRRLVLLGYRMVVLGEYLAFYRFDGRQVEVHRVINGRRRYSFLFPD